SEGRLPDGTGAIVRFPGASTPGTGNIFPLLINAREAAGTVYLEFEAQPGASYVIETRPSLSQGAWQPLTNVASSATLKTISIPLGGVTAEATRFFRLTSPNSTQ